MQDTITADAAGSTGVASLELGASLHTRPEVRCLIIATKEVVLVTSPRTQRLSFVNAVMSALAKM